MPAINRNNYIQDKGFAVHAGSQPGTDLSLSYFVSSVLIDINDAGTGG